jgi:hypothetical protein
MALILEPELAVFLAVPVACWRVGCCLEDVVVRDEAALFVLISASGNCTMSHVRYTSHWHAVIPPPLSLIPIPVYLSGLDTEQKRLA